MLVIASSCACTDSGAGDGPSGLECTGVPLFERDHVDQATRSPDGEGWCCQPGFPTCDCGYYGGFVRDRCDCGHGILGRTPYGGCDVAPPDWVLGTDEHGCMRYTARAATECCGCPPDAGPDTGR